MASGLAAARALEPGTGYFELGAMLTPDVIGGKVDARARFNEHFYGFVEAQGGYSFLHGRSFGAGFLGVGGTF